MGTAAKALRQVRTWTLDPEGAGEGEVVVVVVAGGVGGEVVVVVGGGGG